MQTRFFHRISELWALLHIVQRASVNGEEGADPGTRKLHQASPFLAAAQLIRSQDLRRHAAQEQLQSLRFRSRIDDETARPQLVQRRTGMHRRQLGTLIDYADAISLPQRLTSLAERQNQIAQQRRLARSRRREDQQALFAPSKERMESLQQCIRSADDPPRQADVDGTDLLLAADACPIAESRTAKADPMPALQG